MLLSNIGVFDSNITIARMIQKCSRMEMQKIKLSEDLLASKEVLSCMDGVREQVVVMGVTDRI
jgi:hypothetical protein